MTIAYGYFFAVFFNFRFNIRIDVIINRYFYDMMNNDEYDENQ
ncbi:hypothetical protein FCR2A7T_22380 [Flavobacterium cauense R2A-7]|nr:hypothetical protein FCR2A7T_22380 [Flavobacterium cauense R2A-7]